jgi:methionyl-tRNA synthetase
LLTGTDEHAPKVAQAAIAAGEAIHQFVARNGDAFASLATELSVAYDDFIRTSSDPRHRPAVEAVWSACAAAGDLYRAAYAGWYCSGCEEFVDGRCVEHDAPPEWVEEENWYFRLSRYATRVRELIERDELRVVPDTRRNEVLAFLAGDVRDISVSRSRDRARDWGIPVPGDPDQIVYVWFDALINYVSAAPRGWWADGVEIRHVIGKGIVRFHAVIWPAILLSAGRRLPDEVCVHDYVTTGGRKIGKSLGNAIDPFAVLRAHGADALRWWLLREVPRSGDADFSEARLVETANRDLANGIGNLVHRVTGLGGRLDDGFWRRSTTETVADRRRNLADLGTAVDEAIAAFDLRGATGAIVAEVDAVNRELERLRPWGLTGDARNDAVDQLARRTARIVVELAAFVPDLAQRAGERLRGEAGPRPYERRELAAASGAGGDRATR